MRVDERAWDFQAKGERQFELWTPQALPETLLELILVSDQF